MSQSTKTRPVVSEVKIEMISEECPDTSYLGEYTDEYDTNHICCHCGEYLGDAEGENNEHDCPTSNRDYNYFKPYAGEEKPGTETYKKYGLQDFKRMESLNNGNWYFMGIQAKAVVKYPIGSGNWRLETFTSGGLWGIESDSDEDYIESIKAEQLDDLKAHLEQFGINTLNWNEIEVKEN